MTPTKAAVVIAHTTGRRERFAIKSITSIPFEAQSGADLMELLQRLVALFDHRGKGSVSAIALLGSSSGRFKASVEAIKAQALIELAAAQTGVPVVTVTAASLTQALACARGQKWHARAAELLNADSRHENWSRGAAGAAAAALKVAGGSGRTDGLPSSRVRPLDRSAVRKSSTKR
ncbi:MAG TPA: hypothetical protein VNJ02_20100 [Vicinamibacterales bacterium]|nr:hypothetical protein [Vicinamibacterales bacterium]